MAIYPLDLTGTATTNKIVNEPVAVVPPAEVQDAAFFVPSAAPFFRDGFVIKTGTSPGAQTLVENSDYIFSHDFIEASIDLETPISGGVILTNRNYTGTLYLTYQTLGGDFVQNTIDTVVDLTRRHYHVRTVTWSQVANVPNVFPPAHHEHQINDLVSMSEVVAKLIEIKDAILAAQNNTSPVSIQDVMDLLTAHINSTNAHPKSAVGLGNVENYRPATIQDIIDGTPERYVTADVLRVYLDTHYQSTPDEVLTVLPSRNGNKIDFNISSNISTSNKSVTYDILEGIAAATNTGGSTNETFDATSIRQGDTVTFTITSSDPTSTSTVDYTLQEGN